MFIPRQAFAFGFGILILEIFRIVNLGRYIMWFHLLIGVLLIAMGLAVHVFKWHFLISGYNTMSKEKKANVDTEGLGRLIGIYLYQWRYYNRDGCVKCFG